MAKLSEKLIYQGMTALDHIMGTSDLLLSVAPIRIMVTGGVVAVAYLHTRPATEDLDFILDPNVDAAQDHREEFFRAVKTATEVVEGLPTGWLNDHMRVFIRPDKRQELFLTSVEQNLVIFDGQNIVAYASRLDWALESKLVRIETLLGERRSKKIKTDIADSVALLRLINDARDGEPGDGGGGGSAGACVSAAYLRTLNFNDYKVQSIDKAIEIVASEYKEKYGTGGIAF